MNASIHLIFLPIVGGNSAKTSVRAYSEIAENTRTPRHKNSPPLANPPAPRTHAPYQKIHALNINSSAAQNRERIPSQRSASSPNAICVQSARKMFCPSCPGSGSRLYAASRKFAAARSAKPNVFPIAISKRLKKGPDKNFAGAFFIYCRKIVVWKFKEWLEIAVYKHFLFVLISSCPGFESRVAQKEKTLENTAFQGFLFCPKITKNDQKRSKMSVVHSQCKIGISPVLARL